MILEAAENLPRTMPGNTGLWSSSALNIEVLSNNVQCLQQRWRQRKFTNNEKDHLAVEDDFPIGHEEEP